MTFVFETECITALSAEGIPMGRITFPRINCNLVNISSVRTEPQFRNPEIADSMMEALLEHLAQQNRKAALTCAYAQDYLRRNPRWKHILPGNLHFTAH